MSKFLTRLGGDWMDDDRRFVLARDLIYQSDLLGKLGYGVKIEGLTMVGLIEVPKGFVTDFASVPRVPVIYTMFGDRAHHESVVHDYLYQTNLVPRGVADKVFREAMVAQGKSKFISQGMYLGVVLGGRSSYKTGPSRYQVLNG